MVRLDGLFPAHVSTGRCACVGCKLGTYEVVFAQLVAIAVIPSTGYVHKVSHIVKKDKFIFRRRESGELHTTIIIASCCNTGSIC